MEVFPGVSWWIIHCQASHTLATELTLPAAQTRPVPIQAQSRNPWLLFMSVLSFHVSLEISPLKFWDLTNKDLGFHHSKLGVLKTWGLTHQNRFLIRMAIQPVKAWNRLEQTGRQNQWKAWIQPTTVVVKLDFYGWDNPIHDPAAFSAPEWWVGLGEKDAQVADFRSCYFASEVV